MAKNIICIGYEIPGHSDLFHKFSDGQSLLDADIVVFKPEISREYRFGTVEFQGKICLDESGSFRFREASARWRSDIATLLEAAKTVFVFLDEYESVYIYTGKQQVDGSGKTARRTDVVDTYDNFRCLPVKLPPIIGNSGSGIVFKRNPIFATLWEEFQDRLSYKCYFQSPIGETLFATRVSVRPMLRERGRHLFRRQSFLWWRSICSKVATKSLLVPVAKQSLMVLVRLFDSPILQCPRTRRPSRSIPPLKIAVSDWRPRASRLMVRVAHHASIQGSFFPSRFGGLGTARNPAMIQLRVSAGSITSSNS